ncbi:DUF397 domain-containing protein [Nocardia blacklockiae]|uniref:DUF397 domain-containing protein n=1 Tax=Nocardia blacklockiae TaxID=480036 RepID=UPI0018936DEF|nr:DUF397 domain-containing protein [Nocardia blacklockiae]MBF6171088.1 DUF397 domain-containing protein [Nocardia blacklockiae]
MNVSATAKLHWFKATLSSSSSSCVEVADAGEVWLIRDSKYLRDPRNRQSESGQPTISVSDRLWSRFLDIVLDGGTAGFDGLPSIEYAADGSVSLHADAITLTYWSHEWHAFRDGIQKQEFDRTTSAA